MFQVSPIFLVDYGKPLVSKIFVGWNFFFPPHRAGLKRREWRKFHPNHNQVGFWANPEVETFFEPKPVDLLPRQIPPEAAESQADFLGDDNQTYRTLGFPLEKSKDLRIYKKLENMGEIHKVVFFFAFFFKSCFFFWGGWSFFVWKNCVQFDFWRCWFWWGCQVFKMVLWLPTSSPLKIGQAFPKKETLESSPFARGFLNGTRFRGIKQ